MLGCRKSKEDNVNSELLQFLMFSEELQDLDNLSHPIIVHLPYLNVCFYYIKSKLFCVNGLNEAHHIIDNNQNLLWQTQMCYVQ